MSQIKTRDLIIIGDYSSDAQLNRNNFMSRGALVEGISESSSEDLKGVIFKIRYNIDDSALDFDEYIDAKELFKIVDETNIDPSYTDALEVIVSNYIKDSLDHQISMREYIESLKELNYEEVD